MRFKSDIAEGMSHMASICLATHMQNTGDSVEVMGNWIGHICRSVRGALARDFPDGVPTMLVAASCMSIICMSEKTEEVMEATGMSMDQANKAIIQSMIHPPIGHG